MKKSTPTAPPFLEFRHVSLQRGKIWALKNIHWKIRQGERWAILGPNGSGKSSLVSLFHGHLWPQRGNIYLKNQVYGTQDISLFRKSIAWVGADLENFIPPQQTAVDIVCSGKLGTLGLQFEEPSSALKRESEYLLSKLNLGSKKKNQFRELSQ